MVSDNENFAHNDDDLLAQLIAHARKDPEHLPELIEHVMPFIRQVAREVHYQSTAAAYAPSDLFQDFNCLFCSRFEQFRGTTGNELRAWIRTIMPRIMRNSYRSMTQKKRDVRRNISLDVNNPNDDSQPAHREPMANTPTPSLEIRKREESQRMQNAIGTLSKDHRNVLNLRYQHGLPFGDIATLMKRSEGAVKKLWKRAVGNLRKGLSDGQETQSQNG